MHNAATCVHIFKTKILFLLVKAIYVQGRKFRKQIKVNLNHPYLITRNNRWHFDVCSSRFCQFVGIIVLKSKIELYLRFCKLYFSLKTVLPTFSQASLCSGFLYYYRYFRLTCGVALFQVCVERPRGPDPVPCSAASAPSCPRSSAVWVYHNLWFSCSTESVFVSSFVFSFINIVVKITLKHTYLLASQVFPLTKVFWKCCTYFKYRQSHFQMGFLQPVLGRLIIRHTGWCPFPSLRWPRGPTSFFIFANLAGKGRTYYCFNFYF